MAIGYNPRQRDALAAELARARGQLLEKGEALRQAEGTITQQTFREEELQARCLSGPPGAVKRP